MEYIRRDLDQPGVLTEKELELQAIIENDQAVPRHLRRQKKFVWKSSDQRLREAEEADPVRMALRIEYEKGVTSSLAKLTLLTVGLKKSPNRHSQH